MVLFLVLVAIKKKMQVRKFYIKNNWIKNLIFYNDSYDLSIQF